MSAGEIERHILVKVTPEEEAEIFSILKQEGLSLDGEGIKDFFLNCDNMSPEEENAVFKFGDTLKELQDKYPVQAAAIKKQATHLGSLFLAKILKN